LCTPTDQTTPTGGTCPASTDGSDLLVPGPGPPVYSTFGQGTHTDDICPASSAVFGPQTTSTVQPFALCTPTGVTPVPPGHSFPGLGSARPPADGPGVVSGTPPVQATFGQVTHTGDIYSTSSDGAQGLPDVNCPADTHGTYGPLTSFTVQPFALSTPICVTPVPPD